MTLRTIEAKSFHFIRGMGSVFYLFSGEPLTVQLPYSTGLSIQETLRSDWMKVYADMTRSWETILHDAKLSKHTR